MSMLLYITKPTTQTQSKILANGFPNKSRKNTCQTKKVIRFAEIVESPIKGVKSPAYGKTCYKCNRKNSVCKSITIYQKIPQSMRSDMLFRIHAGHMDIKKCKKKKKKKKEKKLEMYSSV